MCLLCPSYLFLPKASLSLTTTFLGASHFSPFPLIAKPVSLPNLHSPYWPYYHPWMSSEEQFTQQVRTLFYFLLLSSEKCTELQKVLRSNQKPASEFHSNLVSSTDPHDAIKIEDIYTHQIFIFKYISLISQITAAGFLLNCIKTSNRTFWSFAVFLYINIKYYSCFSCAFICSYNWEIIWFLREFFSLYTVIFSRHHFYHLINKCLDVSYIKWLPHCFFYYFKSHLIFNSSSSFALYLKYLLRPKIFCPSSTSFEPK